MNWLVYVLVAVVALMMFAPKTFEKYADYPKVFGNYGMDEWHKYWHEAKFKRVPTKFTNYVPGAQVYNCDQCYYPVPMPFN